ncbi:prefoldin subunit 1 isoform X2 [Zootermopsis nevadensis]|uniref:Prefoldin subunit 1 n=1 Tax=Zootermopsis nevadensis TaxID=136037 RepID=A0A067RFJ4_ZOONE|nr:prefoldin subunit 1 isoform X2 [Zootermopsis nevadensis]KDR18938.1 Prefoldin subunit 1 [Zootermopsis nevadensis]
MAKTVDLELKKAFAELHQKLAETVQKMKAADEEISCLKNSMQHARLMDSEITRLDTSTKIYESVGRMFLLTNISDLHNHLENKSETCAEKIKILESNKSYLERSQKDSENNIREMIQQRREKAQETN